METSAREQGDAAAGSVAGPIPIEILLVEDDAGDARLVELTLEKATVTNRIHTVDDGAKAIEFLLKQGSFANSPTPGLVLLDLMLPKKDGHEVLAEMKASDDLKHIPVVVLTSSKSDKDLLSSYDLKADGFINKPLDLNQFMWIVGHIDSFGITIVELPPR